MLEAALDYQKRGYSVIPVAKDKKPLISWREYQDRIATPEEIKSWFQKTPDANIGIVTGPISNLTVIDCDSQEAITAVRTIYKGTTPTVKTPKGLHYYFKYAEGTRNTVKIKGIDLDLRSEGGYVIAPPSVNSEGLPYRWINDLDSFAVEEVYSIKDFFIYIRESQNNHNSESHKSLESQRVTNYFLSGRRDNDLFHAANCLIKGHAESEFVYQVIKTLAENCNPPFPEKEIETKIQSAIERGKRKERNLTQEIKEWVESRTGYFLVTDWYSESQVVTKQEKHASVVAFKRLCEQGILESYGARSGSYRRKETDLEIIDWQNASEDEYVMRWPLNIHELVKLYPGNIAVVAGASNTGKTSFMLELIRLNQTKRKITYFNSEMAASELRIRLQQFGEICPLNKWNFKAVERSSNFADVIDPEGMNVIDFLEVYDEFWKIGLWIRDIHAKLKSGVAIIAIQKKGSTKIVKNDYGRGGELTLEKPRLYISMDRGKVKIVKGKIWRSSDRNPNGLIKKFKLVGGWKWLHDSDWITEDEEDKYAKQKSYATYGVVGATDEDFPHED